MPKGTPRHRLVVVNPDLVLDSLVVQVVRVVLGLQRVVRVLRARPPPPRLRTRLPAAS